LLTGCLSDQTFQPSSSNGDFLASGSASDLGSPVPDLASDSDLASPTDGPLAELLTVTFNTAQTATPQYAPRNIVAVWIEGPGGTFVKTIGRWAGIRKGYLLGWIAKAGANDMDAVSGATLADHTQKLKVTWDMTAKGGGSVADGVYTIRMELADKDVTGAAANNQGTFTFNRNGTAATQTTMGGGFSNVSIQYTGR
jgi:hypothetical protein